jgi:hypothetical protein
MTAYHGENLGKNKYYFDHGETLPRYLNASPADHPRPHGLEDTRVVKGPVSPTVLDLLDFKVPEGIRGQSVGSSEMLLVN